ncbi:MAG: hypothetical protein H6627_04125 [Calditrichae bacterium]|nr:hypothetical protein [Calditrichia bacterium]
MRENGKLSSLFFFSNQESSNYRSLSQNSKLAMDIHKKLFPGLVKIKRNIHFIVLESFIDPRLIKNIIYNPSPLCQEMDPYLINGQFSHTISPSYGGDTAEAEFELLTGIKGHRIFDSIEFNTMRGGLISSFVSRLAKENYHTSATIASGKEYFNSIIAYKSIGFKQTIFLEDDVHFNRNKEDKHIFDGDLFNYNYDFFKKYKDTNSQPIFNYLLGMYGHIPFNRNKNQRPDLIQSNSTNDNLYKVSNQFYYRTKALAQFIGKIQKIDSTSIIFISSDHLPPILSEDVSYQFNNYVNISLLIDAKKIIDLTDKHYFEISWLLWDILIDEQVERNVDPIEMQDLYYKSLYESIFVVGN